MKYRVHPGLKIALALVLIGFGYQNCSRIQVDSIDEASKVAGVNTEVLPKNCEEAGKNDKDVWWVPNGNSRTMVACKVGTGNQYKIYDEEIEVMCDDGTVKPTGQTQKKDTGRLEGTCNLDCGDKKNNQTWWNFVKTSKDPVACTVGVGTQQKVFNEEAEYKCSNAVISATGKTRRVDTGKIEGECDLSCGTHKNNEKWWDPNGTSKQAVQCVIGTGTQYKIFNEEIEYQCLNAKASPTGQTRRNDSGKIEGTCNLDCGDKKNNELWWVVQDPSSEVKKCVTSLSDTSTINYKNEAEFKCENAVIKGTGKTRQTVLSETACPPLTFNNEDEIATVAYEDIFPGPGDSDYNDFVANIKVEETYNSLQQLTKIRVEYTPVMKLAGYAAQFVLAFDGQIRGRNGFVSNVKDYKTAPMFEGSANIKMETFSASGSLLSTASNVPKDQDLIIFSDTTKAVKDKPKVVVTITNLDPALNTLPLRKGLSIKRYRTVLAVTDDSKKKYDIDLSDINPTMFDSEMQPLAFFVPVNWKAPKAEVNILKPYPSFKDHAIYLYSRQPIENEPASSKRWYDNLKDPSLVGP